MQADLRRQGPDAKRCLYVQTRNPIHTRAVGILGVLGRSLLRVLHPDDPPLSFSTSHVGPGVLLTAAAR